MRFVMTRRIQYLFGVLIIAPLWLVACFKLTMRLVAAEDPGWDNVQTVTHVDGHTLYSIGAKDKGEPPVPVWLKTANAIAMPVVYILPEDGLKRLPDSAVAILFLFSMVTSSMLWGFLIIFGVRFVSRSFTVTKMRVSHESA